jgi:hypothetical protein
MIHRFRILIYFSFFLFGCSSDPLDVDVSDVAVDITLERFDQKMSEVKSANEMSQLNTELIETGGDLYEFYVFDMLRSGSVYDDSVGHYLYYFVSDSIMKLTFADIQSEFREFEDEKNQIDEMFKHLKYHLPDAPIPTSVVTYNSAYSYGVISTDSKIGLGLDMYLGQFNRTIQQLGFPVYMKEKMEKQYLPIDIAHSWLITNVMGEDKGETFLSSMVYYGKLRYAIDAMMPDTEDHLKVRYNEEEYDWALASEYNIWQYILDMNWVYSTDVKVKLRYFEESPTTVGIEGSPGRIGQFMGWQMVRQYMDKHEEVSLDELLNNTEETKILKSYKPEDEQ